MSIPVPSVSRESRPLLQFARASVPIALAAAAVTLALLTVHSPGIAVDDRAGAAPAAPAGPTPYSELYSRIPQAPDEPEDPPPTF